MAERKKAHREKLLHVAIGLFGRHGYHATTVPMIVKESGSSTGAFYFYFRDKEDVFANILEAVGEQVTATLNEAMNGTDPDTISEMKAAVEAFILYLARHPNEARILIIESSGLSSRLTKIRRAIIASHCRSVERALTGISRSIPQLDPRVVARCWMGAVLEPVYAWLESGAKNRIPVEVLAHEISRFNLRGIGFQAQKDPIEKDKDR
jgi:TetR/AcrR family fatty acid metabolism transcriptional regulator